MKTRMMSKGFLVVAAFLAGFLPLVADPSGAIFDKVGGEILTIQCEDAAGVGFVCQFDDGKFLVANRHLIEGQKRVAAFRTDGRELKLGKLQVAKCADLVRFEVRPEESAAVLRTSELKKNEPLYMFRPGEGRDTPAQRGRLVEVLDGQLEIFLKFELPLSGSPVFDEQGAVVGVASMEPVKGLPKNWVKQGYSAAASKRFALRLTGREWVHVELDSLARQLAQRRRKEQVAAGTAPEVTAVFNSPSMRVNRKLVSTEMRYFANGTVSIGFSGSRKFKNPVVRIAALVDCNGQQLVFDAFSLKPNGEYDERTLPIWTYGMPSKNSSYRMKDGSYALYLEGLSFCQPSSEVTKMKGVEYFDRKSLTTGGIELDKDMTSCCDPANPPKIVAFRFECWQNGSLAGFYNSARPDTLNSKQIPVDWFIIGKYPKLFTYNRK